MGIFLLSFFGCVLSFFDYAWVFFCFFSFILLMLVLSNSSFFGFFFLDELSFVLLFLSFCIFLYCMVANFYGSWAEDSKKLYFFLVMVMYFVVFLSFCCLKVFLFYLCFEFIFLLMFFFIMGWGHSEERFQASFYMVFYTLVVSMPFFVFLVFEGVTGLSWLSVWGSFSGYWWFFFLFVFLVKLPVFGVHLWLPKAHVEAPVVGSMLLAGILLKLGGYGLMRVFSFFGDCFYKGFYMFSLGLMSALYSSFLCLRQVDLKSFIAYSSVCHMGVFLLGVFTMSSFGWSGGLLMMVGHGYVSSCLFYILYLVYKRFHTRSGMLLKGSMNVFSVISLFWFIFCILNLGVPPSLSFFSEILIVASAGSFWMEVYFLFGVILIMVGVYNIYLFVLMGLGAGICCGGGVFLSVRESLVVYGHFVFMVLFFLFLMY